jgi:F-type H+-transporting ATPase subunit a
VNGKNSFLTPLSRKISLTFLVALFSGFVLAANAPQEHSDGHATEHEETTEAVSHDSAEVADHSDAHHEDFSAGDMIMEHIRDAHDWHLWGDHDNAVSIPLPIIAYIPGEGITMFSSSHFHHGHDSYEGLFLDGQKLIRVDENDQPLMVDSASQVENEDGSMETVTELVPAPVYDFSITKNAFSIMFASILILWLMIGVGRAYKKNPGRAPRRMQNAVETCICFVRDEIARPLIGEKKHEKFMPFLLTIFFFIWINNMLGLVPFFPGGANTTGNIAIPLVLATFVFVITNINGKKHYWRHTFAMPGIPWPVLIILTPIEIAQIFIRPIVLMIRLFANIMAGHIAMLVFFSLIFIFSNNGESLVGGYGAAVPSVAFTIFLFFLELLVAAIQAYVFTLLSAIYFGMAVAEDHH